MNHLSEWKRIYHPKLEKHVYKHKGTGVITDSLFKTGKVVKKPVVGLLKQAGKNVAEKGINKASDVVVKKAGDKIGTLLRKKTKTKNPSLQKPKVNQPKQNDAFVRLNQLIANL